MALPMSADFFDEAWLDLFAATCARLATPFADRAAVLWRAGFDEHGWIAFERACLEAIAADSGPSHPRAARFADGFVRTRRLLEEVAEPRTVEAPADDMSSWSTLVAPPQPPRENQAADAARLDALQAMTTLASNTRSTSDPKPKG
jgi:hypothetical protein